MVLFVIDNSIVGMWDLNIANGNKYQLDDYNAPLFIISCVPTLLGAVSLEKA